MRTLYESILDSDEQLKDESAFDEFLVLIAKYFHEVFGDMYQSKDSSYDRGFDWVVGRIFLDSLNLPDANQFYHADKEINKKVKKFQSLLRANTNCRCTFKAKTSSTWKYYIRNYNVLCFMKPENQYEQLASFTISIVGTADSVDYIRVITQNDELKRYLCELCIK